MTRIDLSVPDDLGDWAEARAAEARLGGAGEYVAGLLRREREDAEKLVRLQAAIDKGRASGVSECDPLAYLDELRAGLRAARSADAA